MYLVEVNGKKKHFNDYSIADNYFLEQKAKGKKTIILYDNNGGCWIPIKQSVFSDYLKNKFVG